jgi:hypothetical protein
VPALLLLLVALLRALILAAALLLLLATRLLALLIVFHESAPLVAQDGMRRPATGMTRYHRPGFFKKGKDKGNFAPESDS